MPEMFDPPHPDSSLASAKGLATPEEYAEQFASNLSVSSKSISQVIRGEAPITPELAVKFTSAISGPDSAMWLRMQATYDDWQRKHHNPQEL